MKVGCAAALSINDKGSGCIFSIPVHDKVTRQNSAANLISALGSRVFLAETDDKNDLIKRETDIQSYHPVVRSTPRRDRIANQKVSRASYRPRSLEPGAKL